MLATSGTTGAEVESIGNSWEFSHLVEAFSAQWRDAALAARDVKARKSEAVVAAIDNFHLSGLSEDASRIENAISWNDTDPPIVEYEDDDGDCYREDVDWYTGDFDDELDDTAYTASTPTSGPELLEHSDGNLEEGDASASQVYASASRSFKKHVSFWIVSRVPQAIFLLLVLVLLTAWLSHPLIENPAKSRGNGKKGKRKGKSSSQKGGQPTRLGTPGILPKPQTSRFESRPPMSKKRPSEAGATRGGPHHAPRLRPDQCMLCRQVGHRASECPKGKSDCFFIWKTLVLYLCSGLCSVRFSV